ncbi:MAG: succinate dehydrogenase/fumarate reductase iron-sulfur subunit, partial [Chlorobiaceae bacterium]|nr:succinate dehydrogenase/fumarate reductase iron-sulfur subunit [Chlorobiaceae bacterium]
MNFTLKIWRQSNTKAKGSLVTYKVTEISSECSFFEMLDILNQQLITSGGDPVSFDHDCREGICGTCSLYINGRPHGPLKGITTC